MIVAGEGTERSVIAMFSLLQDKKSLAHAYLFIGSSGTGKSETALAIARWINCSDETKRKNAESCGICSSCVKILAGNHPDIYLITDGETDTIKIDQVRDILSQFALRPFMAQKKVFIIKNVEKLTADAANALLKTLEEPSASNLILLTTSVVDKVLPTVKSRCQAIHIPSFSRQKLVAELLKKGDMISGQAEFIAFLSDGSMSTAKHLLAEDVIALRNKVIDQYIFSKNSDDFIKLVLADDEKTKLFLKILLAWVRDAILLKSGVDDERISHRDRKKDLAEFVSKNSFASLNSLYHQVVETYKLLTDHFNIKTSVLIIKESFVV